MKIRTLLYAALLLVLTACNRQELPPTASQFIKQHFPDASLVMVEMEEDDDNGMEYNVWLNDGTKLDFNMTGEWMQVSRKKTGVPAELVPEAIRQYVATNYPEKAIFKLKKRPYGYKIILSDDNDLRFNPQGLFLEEVD